MDPIDNGTKVRLLFRRMTDPEVMRREEEAARKVMRGGAGRSRSATGCASPLHHSTTWLWVGIGVPVRTTTPPLPSLPSRPLPLLVPSAADSPPTAAHLHLHLAAWLLQAEEAAKNKAKDAKPKGGAWAGLPSMGKK